MKATNAELVPERIGEGFLGKSRRSKFDFRHLPLTSRHSAFCLHISTHCAITKYALDRSGVLDGE